MRQAALSAGGRLSPGAGNDAIREPPCLIGRGFHGRLPPRRQSLPTVRAFSHDTPSAGRRRVLPECLAWISGQFISTGVYAYKGEFYNVRWGGFQLGRVLAESAVRQACSPF